MDLSEIDFCNGVGYNLKNIRHKSNLLKSLKTKFNITIQNNDIQFSNKQLFSLKKYNYLLSVLTALRRLSPQQRSRHLRTTSALW